MDPKRPSYSSEGVKLALVKSLVQRLNDRPLDGRVNARRLRLQEARKVHLLEPLVWLADLWAGWLVGSTSGFRNISL